MTEKRYIIDVENENYENAVFFGEEFICYEDDSEQLVNELNKLIAENELLKIESKDFFGYRKELRKENEQLKKENKELREYLCWEEMELEELEDIDKNVIE